MLAAAHANTHKGAIFSLGILCHAAGSCGEGASLDAVLQKAAQTGSVYLRQMQQTRPDKTGGEQQYLRYGLTGDGPLPQHEVARALGISRSYVSRIEKKALEKLRAALEG